MHSHGFVFNFRRKDFPKDYQIAVSLSSKYLSRNLDARFCGTKNSRGGFFRPAKRGNFRLLLSINEFFCHHKNGFADNFSVQDESAFLRR